MQTAEASDDDRGWRPVLPVPNTWSRRSSRTCVRAHVLCVMYAVFDFVVELFVGYAFLSSCEWCMRCLWWCRERYLRGRILHSIHLQPQRQHQLKAFTVPSLFRGVCALAYTARVLAVRGLP
jgi:hypothetical protein